MSERADIDALTGIPLRRSFMTRLGALLASADRKESPLSICILDVDHFKAVNDTHGHISGDRVLSGFGKLLATRFRATDLRARWGGEEFMLAFPGEPPETATAIVERLLEEVRHMGFESESSGRLSITFSAGVASYPVDGSTVHDLVRTVDRRLYVAKRTGRNRVVQQG
jgi:diguanylate cyclase (GGDEF)-like protein